MRIKKIRPVYYYCSVETLLSILHNNQIYASDPLKMNDRDELLWFTKTFSDIKGNDELAHSIGYNVSIDKIAEQLKNEGQDNLFVSCFSELDDDLSQWRGYGDDGQGVAIGFDLNTFVDSYDFAYEFEVIYGSPTPQENLEYFSDFIGVCDSEYDNVDRSSFQSAFFNLMILYMARYKNHTFKAEKEVRLMFEKQEWDYKLLLDCPRKRAISKPNFETEFRLTNNNRDIVEYAKINIPYKGIRKIRIGPKCLLHKNDIEQLVKKYLKYKVDIVESDLSYK